MLTITVKTMDSQSRQFEIEDATNIKDFKEKIAPSVNVPAGNQRLIFQGRVLSDDFQLTQDHNGKVLHLVQRLPVVTTAAASSTSSTNASATSAPGGGGGTFNPAQLSQMIFQQAMNGFENILQGGSISGNVIPNPSNPNEQIMNIQIDLNGRGNLPRPASAPQRTATSQARPSVPPPTYRHAGVSAPRQQLQAVGQNLRQLESVLNQLETLDSRSSSADSTSATQESSASSQEGSGEVFASNLDQGERQDEAMDTGGDLGRSNTSTFQEVPRGEPAPVTSASPSQVPPSNTHPSLSELGTYYSRMLKAQRRLEPFVNQMVDVFNTDPPFSSTQSPEYRRTSQLVTLTLQAQQIMAEIQRLLSMAVIPLGRTPPRTMLLRATAGCQHSPHAPPRRIHHAMQAGMPFVSPRAPMMAPSRPRSGQQQRSPGGPQAGPTATPRLRQGVVTVGPGMSMRWAVPRNSGGSSAPTSGGNVTEGTPGMTTATSSATSGRRSSDATVFRVQPPTYQIQVNATIQPQLSFRDVGMDSTAQSSPQFSTNTPQTFEAATQVQSQTFQTTSSTASSSAQTQSTTGDIPNMPGVNQDMLSNLFQSVAQSVQQLGTQQRPRSGAGIILMQGAPSSGENQNPEDISNMVGQNVFNAVFNQLAGSTQPSPHVIGGAPNVRVVVSTPSGTLPSFSGPAATSAGQSLPTADHSGRPSVDLTNSSDFFDAMDSQSSQNGATRQQESGAQGRPQQQSRPVPPPEPVPDLRELLLGIRNTANILRIDLSQRINEFLQSFGLNFVQTTETPRRYLSVLYQAISSEFTCENILDALQGNVEQIGRLRATVRNVTAQEYFSSTDTSPSTDQLVQISSDVSESVREMTANFFANARSVPDVNLVESNLSLMRHSIQRLLEIIFYDGSTYDEEIARHLRYCFSMWVRMNESLLRGGRRELIQIFRNYSGFQQAGALQLLSSLGPLLASRSDSEPLVFFLNLLTSLQSVTQNQIDQFVLSQAPNVVESENLSFIDMHEQVAPVRSSSSTEHNREHRPRSPRDSVPRSSAGPPSTSSSASQSVRSGGDSWKEEVPAEWVDTIVADAEAQQNMEAQMPFSDAYIAGMPSRKRRKVVS